jgi:hypothetical protein
MYKTKVKLLTSLFYDSYGYFGILRHEGYKGESFAVANLCAGFRSSVEISLAHVADLEVASCWFI